MSSPVKGNFGHIRESGVLLLTQEDSTVKHQRNAILAGYSALALFTLGIGCKPLGIEADKESGIRTLNRVFYKELPYSKCVELIDKSTVVYQNKVYTNPFNQAPASHSNAANCHTCYETEYQRSQKEEIEKKMEAEYARAAAVATAIGGGWE
jgi:hypothetical protein